MSLRARLFLAYLLIVSAAAWFVFDHVIPALTPAVRQSTEEALVDTAHLIAAMASVPLREGKLDQASLEVMFRDFNARQPDATIWQTTKKTTSLRILITDAQGLVIVDSAQEAVGQDYSQWNDIYLTLRGQYGARSTPDPANAGFSVMHVAAPVREGERIIGVVSVAKSARSLEPWIEQTRQRLFLLGGVLVIGGLLAGILLSWWLTRQLRDLQAYAQRVANGEKVTPPGMHGISREFRSLGLALETMRRQLDGKAYVERYTQTLAHELRSPLAGIAATAELLHQPMTDAQREIFICNIEREAARMHSLAERMLTLASLEQQQTLNACTDTLASHIIGELLGTRQKLLEKRNIHVLERVDERVVIHGDRSLISLAISNLLDNAIDFCNEGGVLTIEACIRHGITQVSLHNQGPAIPDYALTRVGERFFSLPRPGRGARSSGLGLNFVNEIMALHQGELKIGNNRDGVEAILSFPSRSLHTISS
jgi:two-component system sensor histidine kinase CreC